MKRRKLQLVGERCIEAAVLTEKKVCGRASYEKPSVECVRVGMESALMTTSGTGLEIIEEDAIPGNPVYSNTRRGSWGDLWNETDYLNN